jgi:hypothetical protein
VSDSGGLPRYLADSGHGKPLLTGRRIKALDFSTMARLPATGSSPSPMPRNPRFAAICLLLSAACLTPAASAFGPNPPSTVDVVEYQNIAVGHYFLTADAGEQETLDSGAAGPGWYRTGRGFRAFAYPQSYGFVGEVVWVDRFHGTPGSGPNSHFFTADPAESSGLKRSGSGWSYEGPAFAATSYTGQCVSGEPIHRLFNNRAMLNDANHRYVAASGDIGEMQLKGWIDEGVAFCAYPMEMPFKAFELSVPAGKILPGAKCDDESSNVGGCIAVSNLPLPNVRNGPVANYMDSYAMTLITSMSSAYFYAPARVDPKIAINGTFLQGQDWVWGIHLDTGSRGGSPYSSIDAVYRFPTGASATEPDVRLFPFAIPSPFGTQLVITSSVNVSRLEARSANSFAYGHPSIDFADKVSGHSFRLNVLAYGNLTGGDFAARDVVSGLTMVGTTFRPGSPYGRSTGSNTLYIPSGTHGTGGETNYYGGFQLRIDSAEFRHVLASARQVDAALSMEPGDYFVRSFRFHNEVVNDGELGLNLSRVQLGVMRR